MVVVTASDRVDIVEVIVELAGSTVVVVSTSLMVVVAVASAVLWIEVCVAGDTVDGGLGGVAALVLLAKLIASVLAVVAGACVVVMMNGLRGPIARRGLRVFPVLLAELIGWSCGRIGTGFGS